MRERPESSRNTKSDVLKAGLVAVSLLGAHENLEAADIPPDATWEQGVSELHRSVIQEPVEYAAAAALLNQAVIWPRTLRGEVDGVRAHYSGMIKQLVVQSQGQPVLNYCDIHTHNVAGAAHEF